MIALSILLSYLLLTAASIMMCLATLEWLMKPQTRQQHKGVDLSWTF